MPYKSKAQQGKFHQLAAEGKISKKTVAEFDRSSKGMKLPERITPKKKPDIKSIDDIRSYTKKRFSK